jgi:hypothetical protein
MEASALQNQHFTDLALQLGGVAPNVIRELSGIYPTFVSAFKELVSNSYDADATLVTLHFSPGLSMITIDDNGAGMTPFEFQNEYIRIGGSLQRRGQDLTSGGRRPIGRKGIGFLAVARYCRQVEIHSHADREVTFRENAILELSEKIPFFQGPFSHALAPVTTVQAVWCGPVELTPDDYRQDGSSIELTAQAWSRLHLDRQPEKVSDQQLTIQYSVDCRRVDVQATIDYNYLLALDDNRNLETLQDFCRVRLIPHATTPLPHFTQVKLHLREFVQRELQAPQRKGWVRNRASGGGLDRFLWHLSRNVPVSYDLSIQELKHRGLEALVFPISPTSFTIKVVDTNNVAHQLNRPLFSEIDAADAGQSVLVRHPIQIESNGLVALGYLLGFSQPVFPAELRGIAIRVRGIEIGQPGYLNVENDLPVKYRSYLNQVVGEIIVTEGLDAISAIMPGREGFYAESSQFQELCRHLVGDGTVNLGALGQVLERLHKRQSVESSVARITQEAKRRRQAFLDIAQALTALSVGSRYGRSLRRLFSRSDIVVNGLGSAPEYQAQLPSMIGDYLLELSDLAEADYDLDTEPGVVRLNRNADMWNSSLYILGRDFNISLRNGQPDDPVCEIDFSTNIIYINWMHPTRGKMGDPMFMKSALFWRTAYLAADGDVDLMMNLAHRLLSYTP